MKIPYLNIDILHIIIMYIISIVLLVIGSITGYYLVIQNNISYSYIKKTQQFLLSFLDKPLQIFLNNLTACTLMYIPFVGLILYIYIMLNTGYLSGLLTTWNLLQKCSYNCNLLALTFSISSVLYTSILPFAVLEFISYGMAFLTSLSLTFLIVKGKFSELKMFWKVFTLRYLTTTILLLIAAYVEVLIIKSTSTYIHQFFM